MVGVVEFTRDHRDWFEPWLTLVQALCEAPSNEITAMHGCSHIDTRVAVVTMDAGTVDIIRSHWGVEKGLHRLLREATPRP